MEPDHEQNIREAVASLEPHEREALMDLGIGDVLKIGTLVAQLFQGATSGHIDQPIRGIHIRNTIWDGKFTADRRP